MLKLKMETSVERAGDAGEGSPGHLTSRQVFSTSSPLASLEMLETLLL